MGFGLGNLVTNPKPPIRNDGRRVFQKEISITKLIFSYN